MKKSKFHYTSDILLFGIATPLTTIFLLKQSITQNWIVLEDTVLLDFIKGFTPTKMSNIIIISTLCLTCFGSIAYCINLGYNRSLITARSYKKLTDLILIFGIATTLILISTLVLSELQISIFTSWISLVALIVSLSKLSLNSNRDRIENNRNNKQGTQDTIEE